MRESARDGEDGRVAGKESERASEQAGRPSQAFYMHAESVGVVRASETDGEENKSREQEEKRRSDLVARGRERSDGKESDVVWGWA